VSTTTTLADASENPVGTGLPRATRDMGCDRKLHLWARGFGQTAPRAVDPLGARHQRSPVFGMIALGSRLPRYGTSGACSTSLDNTVKAGYLESVRM